jgi:hypothetical protein
MNEVTKEDLLNLRHMLGVNENVKPKNYGYRNFFDASGGSDQKPSMERLALAGLVVAGHDVDVYHATEMGALAAGLSEKQARAFR